MASSVRGETPPAAVKPIILATDCEGTSFACRWTTMIYDEAFKRLGVPFRLESYTLARRAAMVEDGAIDGETSRIYAYGDTRPYLVRVEEPLIPLGFALYAASPDLRLERLEDLRDTHHLVEFRRGILICENHLRAHVSPERLSDVPTTKQGLKKLLARRTDLYCDIDLYVRDVVLSQELGSEGSRIRKVISIGDAVPTYPYLHKKHSALAPRLAAVLKQMRAEGLIEAYRLRVEQGFGPKR